MDTHRTLGIQLSIWSLAQVVWDTCVLGPWLGETVGEDKTRERNVGKVLDHISLFDAQCAHAL